MAENKSSNTPELSKRPDAVNTTIHLATEIDPSASNIDLPAALSQISNAFSTLAESLSRIFSQEMQAYWSSQFALLQETASRLLKSVANFKSPTLTDEEAEQLVESNRLWGQYGWTYMPSMPMSMFDTPPADLAEANKLAMQYCTASEMEKIFADLRKRKLNHKDLDSAIFCYQNQQYKACALLLCSMIENKLIRLREDDGRPVGSGAVKELKKKYYDSGEKILAEAMFAQNLLAYLGTLFLTIKGLKNEPDTLNRNYISHGMNRRMVRKRDCVQLFLALNNLMQFFDLDLLKP